MRVLALDTAGPSLSVAALDGQRLVFDCTTQTGLTHSQGLMPLVEQALATAGWAVQSLELIAVVIGPGSFTGVRIGVTTARALAQAWDLPCLGVDALEAMAAGIAGNGLVCAMQDARLDQVYTAVFQAGWPPLRLCEDRACSVDEALAYARGLGKDAWFVGDGAVRHWQAIEADWGEGARLAPPHLQPLRAASAAGLACARSDLAHSHRELVPLYLRLPQAERERLEREAKRG